MTFLTAHRGRLEGQATGVDFGAKSQIHFFRSESAAHSRYEARMVGVVGPKQSQPFQDRNRHEHVVINTREVMPSMAPSLLKIQRRNSGDAQSNRDIM